MDPTQTQWLENVGNGIILTDRAGRIIFANTTISNLSGYSREEILGSKPSKFKSGVQNAATYEEMWKTITSGRQWQGQVLNKRRDGSLYRVRLTITPIYEDGEISGFMGVQEDVTERERLKSAVTKQGSLLVDLSQRLPGLILQLQLGPDGHPSVAFASKRLRDFLGFEQHEVSADARRLFDHCPDAVRARVWEQIRESARTGTELDIEFNVQKPGDSTPIWISMTANPERQGDRSVLLHGYLANVTDRKMAEMRLNESLAKLRKQNEELRVARHEAGKAERAKSSFLNSISHELRTPLNAIVGGSELLAQTELDSNQSEFLSLIRQGSNSLCDIITEILDFSQYEAGRLLLPVQRFDLTEVFYGTIDLLRPRFKAKGLEVLVSTDLENVNVRGLAQAVQQVLLNLGSNALKFTEAGSVTFSLERIGPGDEGTTFKVSVTDTGIGIAEDKLQEIFEPFTQVDNSLTRKYEGAGLGLTISRQMVHQMGGSIGVNSTLGQGSTFWFTFDMPELLLAPEKSGTSSPSGQSRTPRLLVVEDDPSSAELTRLLLAGSGMEAEFASNGPDALDALSSRPFDLVLMDCHMPGMSGFEVSQRVRDGACGALNREVPIVALTALVLPADAQQCFESGMDEHLAKPISRDELLSNVRRVLKTRNGKFDG